MAWLENILAEIWYWFAIGFLTVLTLVLLLLAFCGSIAGVASLVKWLASRRGWGTNTERQGNDGEELADLERSIGEHCPDWPLRSDASPRSSTTIVQEGQLQGMQSAVYEFRPGQNYQA
jgi:hypothetical protein